MDIVKSYVIVMGSLFTIAAIMFLNEAPLLTIIYGIGATIILVLYLNHIDWFERLQSILKTRIKKPPNEKTKMVVY